MQNLIGTSVIHAANPFTSSEDDALIPTLCGNFASQAISSPWTDSSVDCKSCLRRIAPLHALALRINEAIDKGVSDAHKHLMADVHSPERGWDDAKLADKLSALYDALAVDIQVASDSGLNDVVEGWIIARSGFITVYQGERDRRERVAGEIEAYRVQNALDTAVMSAERVALATPNWEPITSDGGSFAQDDKVLAVEIERMREQTNKYLSGEWSYGDDLGLVRDHAHVTHLMELELARRTRRAQDFEQQVAQVERTQEQRADERVRLVRAEELQRALLRGSLLAGRPEPSPAELEAAVVSSDHTEAIEEDRARFRYESFTRFFPPMGVMHRLADGTMESVLMVGSDVSRRTFDQNMVLIVRDNGMLQAVSEGSVLQNYSLPTWPAATNEGVICGNCTHWDGTGDRVIVRHASTDDVRRCYQQRYDEEAEAMEALAEQAAERRAERFYEERGSHGY